MKAGDTLWAIARDHGVEGGWQRLYQLNRDILDDANMIYPGQRLRLGAR